MKYYFSFLLGWIGLAISIYVIVDRDVGSFASFPGHGLVAQRASRNLDILLVRRLAQVELVANVVLAAQIRDKQMLINKGNINKSERNKDRNYQKTS